MKLPLEDIRVLDLSRLLPGAFCTQLFADFGAEVIKIEEPEKGDYERWYEPKQGEYSAIFNSLNRNKKSITLNLKNDVDRETFIELVKTADILIESFRPGVMDRLGVGYEKLKQVNPSLIYCAITGFGQTGPYRHIAAHDINYISYAGLMNFQSTDENIPMPPATQIADIGGGSLMAAVGTLIAFIHQGKTGKGQFVDISMTDGVVSWLQTLIPNYLAGENVDKHNNPFTGGKASYYVYETSDSRYLAVGAPEPRFWKDFCEGIGRTDFVALLHGDSSTQEMLKNEIQKIIKEKSLHEWLRIFKDSDSCVSPVLTFDELVNDPQVIDRKMIIEVEDEQLGKVKQIGFPIKLSDTPGQVRTLAPRLGEHNEEIERLLLHRQS